MNQDEIIEMARQAGCGHEAVDLRWVCPENLDAFAKLVADVATAKEREAMIAESAKQGWVMKNEDPFEDCVKEIAEIRARGEA